MKSTFTSRVSLCLTLCVLCLTASAINLTPENWEAETSGKTVFIKMFAPWVSVFVDLPPSWMLTNVFCYSVGIARK
jgi:hypothetical protein